MNKDPPWSTQDKVLLAAPLWQPPLLASSPLALMKSKTNLHQSTQNLALIASNFIDVPGLRIIHISFLSATPATNMPKASLQIPEDMD